MSYQKSEHSYPTEPLRPDDDEDRHWMDCVVTVKQPPAAALMGHDRREKLQILEANARQQRAKLIEWIEQHGLAGEVNAIGGPTSFNLFFIQCTPRAAQAIKDAPGVLSVTTENKSNLAPMVAEVDGFPTLPDTLGMTSSTPIH
jgi:hypothetical protein